MKIETLKLWDDRDDVELTTFLTMPDPFFPDPIKKPAVIVCPGGGYNNCPRHGTEGDAVAMTFAADGYQGFVLEYSVAEKAPKEKVLFPNQLLDFGKAILTIREHADEWYVDVNRISIIGFSAGAHLCGMLATTWHQDLLSGYFHEDPEVFRPLAAMCIYGLFDYVYQNEFNRSQAGSSNPMLQGDLCTHVFGVSVPERTEEEKYSPYYQVSEKTCPMFMAAAINDGLVPAIQSVRMAEKLHEAGVPYELHMFQYGDHGFGLGRNLVEPFRNELAHACAEWVPLAKTFLMHQITPETTDKEKDPFAIFEE
ncbi:MAG: alpha/beta hydrolase [Clostridiales bacterium]|nr:alpha/beta hydrolase [Clostridiales bacterium]